MSKAQMIIRAYNLDRWTITNACSHFINKMYQRLQTERDERRDYLIMLTRTRATHINRLLAQTQIAH